MSLQDEIDIECPYCGEWITVLIDSTAGAQEYIEDCQVCCKPINIYVTVDAAGIPQVVAQSDDE